MSCIFCKIIAGEIPSLKVFEDDRVYAFLDIGPLAEGHLLVIPKEHYETLDRMPGELAGVVTSHLPRLAKAVVSASGAEGYNVLQNNGKCAGQEVDHVHFHIIPRVGSDDLGYRWNAKKYEEGRDKQMQKKIVDALED